MNYIVDKFVENSVDNSEDNCVENSQNLENQLPQWVSNWTNYLLKQCLDDEKLYESSFKIISEILMASLQGDSCLKQNGHNVGHLKALFIAEDQIADKDQAQQQVAPFVVDDEYLYLYRYWQLEQRLAQQIIRLKQQSIDAILTENFNDLLSDSHQKNALNMVAQNALNIITGGPGTGKTYTLARIIAVLHQALPNIRIAMAAPTGKAAQRMGEALQKSLSDPKLQSFGLRLEMFNPVTIHRLLGLGNQHIPRFHLKQPLPYDVIVVDEASMLDLNLAAMLFEAVPENCRLILLGDANQLASVDVGAVLADLQRVAALQDNRVNLVTTHRFKQDAAIGKFAHFIQQDHIFEQAQSSLLQAFEKNIVTQNQIETVELHADLQDIVQLEYLPEQIAADLYREYYQKLALGFQGYFNSLIDYLDDIESPEQIESVIQAFDQYRVLTAVRHGGLGLRAINAEMEQALLKAIPQLYRQGDWYVGRPVMMDYNDYQLGLSNGDIGVCFKHRQQVGQFEVYFPSLNKWIAASRLPKSIQTAFALTIHKSQGSEFQHTMVVLDASAQRLLSQELLYTAITRAKSVVSLLVNKDAFYQALTVATQRQSGLLKKINI